MGWFRKKEVVPEVPHSSTVMDSPNRYGDELPELPGSQEGRGNSGFNQGIVKSAVGNDFIPKRNEDNENYLIPSKSNDNELPKSDLQLGSPMMAPQKEIPKSQPPKKKHTGPIFVRFDKFEESKKGFEEIREKINDIESTLDKINNVKQREDEELKSWGEEVEDIKSKLSEIDSEIFSQI